MEVQVRCRRASRADASVTELPVPAPPEEAEEAASGSTRQPGLLAAQAQGQLAAAEASDRHQSQAPDIRILA